MTANLWRVEWFMFTLQLLYGHNGPKLMVHTIFYAAVCKEHILTQTDEPYELRRVSTPSTFEAL